MHGFRLLAALTFVLAFKAGSATADQLSHFPSPHKDWTTGDYVDFYFAHYNGNRALPHLRTQDSARLFNHVVNRKNVLHILGSAASDKQKRRELALISATMGEVRAAYGYAVFVGEPLQEELVRIQSFMLFLIDASLGLEEQGTGPAGGTAWKTTLWNVVDSLSERNIYSRRQIASLCVAIRDHYPRMAVALTAPEKQILRARIARLVETGSEAQTRRAQLDLLDTMLRY